MPNEIMKLFGILKGRKINIGMWQLIITWEVNAVKLMTKNDNNQHREIKTTSFSPSFQLLSRNGQYDQTLYN